MSVCVCLCAFICVCFSISNIFNWNYCVLLADWQALGCFLWMFLVYLFYFRFFFFHKWVYVCVFMLIFYVFNWVLMIVADGLGVYKWVTEPFWIFDLQKIKKGFKIIIKFLAINQKATQNTNRKKNEIKLKWQQKLKKRENKNRRTDIQQNKIAIQFHLSHKNQLKLIVQQTKTQFVIK